MFIEAGLVKRESFWLEECGWEENTYYRRDTFSSLVDVLRWALVDYHKATMDSKIRVLITGDFVAMEYGESHDDCWRLIVTDTILTLDWIGRDDGEFGSNSPPVIFSLVWPVTNSGLELELRLLAPAGRPFLEGEFATVAVIQNLPVICYNLRDPLSLKSCVTIQGSSESFSDWILSNRRILTLSKVSSLQLTLS